MKIKEPLSIIVATIVFVAVVIMGLMSISSMGYPAGYVSGFLSVMTVSAIAIAVSFVSYILTWGMLKLLRKNNNVV